MKDDGSVKVYIETPVQDGGFNSAVCWLPGYAWENVTGFSQQGVGIPRLFLLINSDLVEGAIEGTGA